MAVARINVGGQTEVADKPLSSKANTGREREDQIPGAFYAGVSVGVIFWGIFEVEGIYKGAAVQINIAVVSGTSPTLKVYRPNRDFFLPGFSTITLLAAVFFGEGFL